MSIAQQIRTQVEAFAEGEVFKYDALDYPPDKFLAVSKTLSRLVKDGEIRRLMKGRFYRPRLSVFGELPPTDEEVLKEYLFEDGQRIGYPTGLALYNYMGLTTQVPAMYTIAGKRKAKRKKSGNTQFELIRSQVSVSDENYKMLGILDALRDFKFIQDIDIELGLKTIKFLIEVLDKDDVELIMKLSSQYPPRTTSLLGSILNAVHPSVDTHELSNRLKNGYIYRLVVNPSNLLNPDKWKIKWD